ncbi:hypothetical protein P7F60_06375 [Rhizobium sp. YJ-22]|uniref:hypothetical protein n=1 Tax=Rhizobium sp. YJ-22 TaxID=3037556 RepID=UPI002412948A|nr:hypothetical protein [Rhizobium sp. YJ-22]MDG3576002.1 hypothetical protein [Rhizobium sp. YJ-22]
MIADLENLVSIVEGKLAGLPPTGIDEPRPRQKAYFAAADDALQSLEDDHGARVIRKHDAQHMTLGGVKTSCTYGSVGLMLNWKAAAERKIAMLKEPIR